MSGPAGASGTRAGERPVALPTRQARPGYAAVALTLILALGATGGWLFQRAGAKTSVVVVARQVSAGHQVTRADLSTVDVAGAVPAVAAGDLGGLIGQSATVDLLPGTLVQRAMVTAADPLPAGQAQVGVALGGGRVPAGGLEPGAVVSVVRVPLSGADPVPARQGAGSNGTGGTGSAGPGAGEVLVTRAEVFEVRADPAQVGRILVTLVVAQERAVAVAAAGAVGQVALIRVGGS